MILQIGGYVLFLAAWTFVKIRSLLIKRQTKEAAVYGGLVGLSAVFGSLLIAGVDIPSMIAPFITVFRPIGKMILKL